MLSTDQLAQFHDQGFILVKGLVPPAAIATLAAEIDALHEQMAAAAPAGVGVSWEEGLAEDEPKRIRQLMNSERVSPSIEQILNSEPMLDIVEQIVGPRIALYHSKLMMKAAYKGTFTPWHQDWGYWRHSSLQPSQVNCMLSIDGSSIANGCIRFVAGSHKQGPVDHRQFKSASFNIGLANELDAFPDAIPVETEPGDGIFFGSLVIHGSAPNTSPQHRRANTFAFDAAGNWIKEEGNARERILRDRVAASV